MTESLDTIKKTLQPSFTLSPKENAHNKYYIGYDSIILDEQGRGFSTKHNIRHGSKLCNFVGDDSRFEGMKNYTSSTVEKPTECKTQEECDTLLLDEDTHNHKYINSWVAEEKLKLEEEFKISKKAVLGKPQSEEKVAFKKREYSIKYRLLHSSEDFINTLAILVFIDHPTYSVLTCVLRDVAKGISCKGTWFPSKKEKINSNLFTLRQISFANLQHSVEKAISEIEII